MSRAGRAVDYAQMDDSALADRLGQADRAALAEAFRRHGTMCYRLARRVTANDALAEDAVQDAFLGMWRSPGSFAPGRGGLGSWLLTLTHRRSVDLVRRESAHQRRSAAEAAMFTLAEAAEDGPEASAWRAERRHRVRAALGELPGAQREALALAYFAGYTQREIATLTGVPLGTVKTRMMAAMRRLRETLLPLADAGPDGGR